jgi:hypothetical protein
VCLVVHDDGRTVEASSRPVLSDGMAKKSISTREHSSARCTRLGPTIDAAAAITAFGAIARIARRVGRDKDRVADQVHLGSNRRHRASRVVYSLAISCTSGSAKLSLLKRRSARSRTEWPWML